MTAVAKALAEYAASYSAPAFDWATANCCHWAAGWVRLRTGRDPMAGLPVTATRKEAHRLVRAMGGIRSLITDQTGLRQVAASFAQVGDIVLREAPEMGFTVGICSGRTAMHVDDQGAVVHLEMAGALCAWRVEASC